MTELTKFDCCKVSGGIAPLAAIGYFVGGTTFGIGCASGVMWLVQKIKHK